MKISPNVMGVIYLTIGVLFVFLAIQSVSEASWNVLAVFFVALAAFDFVIAFRFFRMQNPKEE